jgi:hypothetical protein
MTKTTKTRILGKAFAESKTKPGRTVYKEIVTEGNFKFQVRDGNNGWREEVCRMVEVVPVHTPCHVCKKFIGNFEADMAKYMMEPTICGSCKKQQIEREIDNKDPAEIKCKHTEQQYVCFECFEDMCNDY